MSKSKPLNHRKNWLSALGMVVLVSFFVLLFMISRVSPITEGDANIIGNFIEWFGVLYGVLLALVVVEVWQRYSLINTEVDREADALVLLLKTAGFFSKREKLQPLVTHLLDYSKMMVKAKDFASLSQTKVNKKLDEIHSEVGEILQENHFPLPLSLEMVRYINDAIDQRGDWLSRVRERMPRGLWTLLVFTSLFWVVGFFGLNIENDALALTICAVATFTVSAIIFIVADLDDPIGGFWRIRFESFEVLQKDTKALLRRLKKEKNAAPMENSVGKSRLAGKIGDSA